MFQSFSSRGWVARELRNVHIDDYVQFADYVRHVYLDELGVGPAVEDMDSFLSSCPELSRREYTWKLFKLRSLCLGHISHKLPDVSLVSSKVGVTSVDLSSAIELIQGYLLSCDSEEKFFLDPESISSCLELLRVSVIGLYSMTIILGSQLMFTEKTRAELQKSYKTVRVASVVESSSSLSEPAFVLEKLPQQRRRPAQRSRIDIGKTHCSGIAELVAGKLRSKRKSSDAESSYVLE